MKELIIFHVSLVRIFFSDLRSGLTAYFPSSDANGFNKNYIADIRIVSNAKFRYDEIASTYYLNSVHHTKVCVITSNKFYVSLFHDEDQKYTYHSMREIPELLKEHSPDSMFFSNKTTCYVIFATVICNISSLVGVFVHFILPLI